MIPVEYFLVRKHSLETILSSIPTVTEGTHRGKHIYYYVDNNKRREVSERSKDRDKAAGYCRVRKKCIAQLDAINKILKSEYRSANKSASYEIVGIENKMDTDYYNSLVDCSCGYKNDTQYYYKGRHYRSRSEMDIAVVLDELGLEFKYDVKVTINGVTFAVDFVILFREFNRCVYLEFFGRSDDPDYIENKIIPKIRNSAYEDLILGRDLFVISGTKNYTPSIPVIRTFVIAMIESLALYHIRVYG